MILYSTHQSKTQSPNSLRSDDGHDDVDPDENLAGEEGVTMIIKSVAEEEMFLFTTAANTSNFWFFL